ncbi:tRNA pseudouridine(38-40) synthase TruA [Parahaliea mediterranea]|uniref:tRNA pseudouridine synthase A n=1 Tax=Parahaliea mediterranea TaxID=651086 RepID=A0A939DIA1_9GAMM|nr:tRNA pseudouridine(38-40) synthase TruA [Parahaliea mediterranea]MBN7798666.1 tRNA pseudouridine(38-40) synthase TruA [Parahaliea mediterranea]
MADTSFPRPLAPEPLAAGARVACRIEYDGGHYSGWQAQPHLEVATVQQTLEAALGRVANTEVRVHCAGRTDTGVHGFAQVVHFDPPVARSPKAWVLGTNANLPHDVRVHWAQAVPEDFHARFSALARRYRYIIANTPVRPAHLAGQVTWQRRPLDADLMHREAQCLLGERDFSAFRAAACQSTSPNRNVHAITVTRRGSLVVIDIRANAFLHHMVRNIAGSLMAVGSGRQSAGWLAALLAGRDRTLAADTAPPDGLYLVDVSYPRRFELPETPAGPLLLEG